MKRLVSSIMLAAAMAAASFAVRTCIERGTRRRRPRPVIENWENEGGALAPQHAPMETSQVPR
jgi:hypothetical protein